MIDNKILEQNIRLIQNVLCQKRKLQNTDIRHDKMIHLIKKNQFPLIPSLLSFLNDKKQFQALHSFKLNVNILQSLIEHQRSNSQIATNNDYGFHGGQLWSGQAVAHVIGNIVVLANNDIGTVLDQNGIRWIGTNYGINGVQILFGKQLADKYNKQVNEFNIKYKDLHSDYNFVRTFFYAGFKQFLLNNKDELKRQYVRSTATPTSRYSQYIISNYKIKSIILPVTIDQHKYQKFFDILNNYHIKYYKLDNIDDYIRTTINPEYHSQKLYDEKIYNYQYFLNKIKNNEISLSVVPQKHKTQQMCTAAVKQNVSALKYLPQKFKTYQFYLDVVKNNGSLLEYVPQKLKTYQICLIAIKQCGYALQCVPQKFMTYQLCLAAVKRYGYALQYVPQKHKTQQMCTAAVKQNGYALYYVPQKFKTQQMCWTVVKQNGRALEYVPQKLKTQQMCTAAVKKDGHALYYVPQKLKTQQMCTAAVKQYSLALKFVPQKHKTQQLCLIAVKKNGYALQYVPQKFKTQQMCWTAVKQDGRALYYVPWELKDKIKRELNIHA